MKIYLALALAIVLILLYFDSKLLTAIAIGVLVSIFSCDTVTGGLWGFKKNVKIKVPKRDLISPRLEDCDIYYDEIIRHITPNELIGEDAFKSMRAGFNKVMTDLKTNQDNCFVNSMVKAGRFVNNNGKIEVNMGQIEEFKSKSSPLADYLNDTDDYGKYYSNDKYCVREVNRDDAMCNGHAIVILKDFDIARFNILAVNDADKELISDMSNYINRYYKENFYGSEKPQNEELFNKWKETINDKYDATNYSNTIYNPNLRPKDREHHIHKITGLFFECFPNAADGLYMHVLDMRHINDNYIKKMHHLVPVECI